MEYGPWLLAVVGDHSRRVGICIRYRLFDSIASIESEIHPVKVFSTAFAGMVATELRTIAGRFSRDAWYRIHFGDCD